MNAIKRLLCTITCALAAVCVLSVCAYAAQGDIVGKIYSTDITAKISGNEVPSYNIGGRTVIVLEEIQNLYAGFNCEYNDEERLMTVYAGTGNNMDTHIERGETGLVLGNVYDTDIKVLLNGSYIQGYNIGGQTAVCIEDMGDLTDSPNAGYGYSKYTARYIWDEEERTISLEFADHTPNKQQLTSDVSQYVFYYNDNVITASYDEMNNYSSTYGYSDGSAFNNTPEFEAEKYVIKPLYMKIGDETIDIGICYVTEDGFTYTNYTDYDALIQRLNDYKKSQKKTYTYDEIIKKFNDGKNYEIKKSLETEDYVMLLAKRLNGENTIDYVSVAKSGDFAILYTSDEYSSMDLSKTAANTVEVNIYPFAGMHGPAWMSMQFDLTFE